MSVLNTVKRTCLILLAIMYYRNQVRPVTFAGTALIVVGVLAYTLEKSRAAAVAGSEATERTVALSLRKRVRIPSLGRLPPRRTVPLASPKRASVVGSDIGLSWSEEGNDDTIAWGSVVSPRPSQSR